MDGTAILDIKPYIPYSDCHTQATGGFSKDGKSMLLNVTIPDELICLIPEGKRAALLRILELDPRPAYQDDESRIYGFGFAGFEIRFTVSNKTLTVCDIFKI